MSEGKKIESILVDGQGYVYSKDGEISVFYVNGEMAQVRWFRQKSSEWNGRYVIAVNYYSDDLANPTESDDTHA